MPSIYNALTTIIISIFLIKKRILLHVHQALHNEFHISTTLYHEQFKAHSSFSSNNFITHNFLTHFLNVFFQANGIILKNVFLESIQKVAMVEGDAAVCNMSCSPQRVRCYILQKPYNYPTRTPTQLFCVQKRKKKFLEIRILLCRKRKLITSFDNSYQIQTDH